MMKMSSTLFSPATPVTLYDTTLRDGTQREGISLSVEDKLKIARKLDELGIHYIEGGYPGSNPKDREFFVRARMLPWRKARIVAFGSSRYKDNRAENDPNLRALLDAGTETVTIVCKNSRLHVERVLGTTLENNLRMIADSIGFLKQRGREVFYDAEHFFDGYKENPAYARACLRAAFEAGADCLVLCDTNGGTLTSELASIVRAVVDEFGPLGAKIGIHTHNDCELAVANSLAAIEAGAVHVQGTINGYGERCGNANLCAIIPNLKLKMGIDCVSWEELARLTEVSRYVAEIANLIHDNHMAYVGASAFAHKAGYHADGMLKEPTSYQHVDPALVGNGQRILVSELSGKASILGKAREFGIELGSKEAAAAFFERVKELEKQGYQFEGAEASFELLLRRAAPDYRPPFKVIDFLALVETRRGSAVFAEATVKLEINGEIQHTVADGNGPVHALDQALRKALLPYYPEVANLRLTDYKVRVIDGTSATAAAVRVLIESTDSVRRWSTVGASTNIIEASWFALVDSLEYGLLVVQRALAREPAGA
jgi:2-isopropylmalate synthase